MSNFVQPNTAKALCAGMALCISSLSPAAAQAPDAMTAGNAAYLKGDYRLARKYFEHVSVNRPSWLAFYQLANADVKLGDLNRAEQEYKRSMMLSTDRKVINNCRAAVENIARIRKYGVPSPAVAAAPAASPSGGSTFHATGGIPANAAEIAAGNDIVAKKALLKKLQAEHEKNQLALKLVVKASDDFTKRRNEAIAKREAILKEGLEDAERARAAGRAEIKDNSNYLCRNSQTGELSIDVPTEIEENIEARWEAEAQRRIKNSEIRARGVQIPDYDNTAHHMLHGLKDDGRGGTRMSAQGTNLHVRNYVHEPRRSTGPNRQVAGTPSASTPAK
jgi:tetratricopeptide (TPR) repeat protein